MLTYRFKLYTRTIIIIIKASTFISIESGNLTHDLIIYLITNMVLECAIRITVYAAQCKMYLYCSITLYTVLSTRQQVSFSCGL